MKLNLIEIKIIITLLETRISKIDEAFNSERDIEALDYLIADVIDYEILLRKMQRELEIRG